MIDSGAARELHQLTRHGSPADDPRLVSFRPLDPSNRPAPFKRYLDRDAVPLPSELGETGGSAVDVLSGIGPSQPAILDATVLARLLFFTAGVTRTSSSAVFDTPAYFRTAMSAGNLHPVELSVACSGIDGVSDGVHHFAPLEFGLTQLREGSSSEGSPSEDPSCHVVLTGIPWRTAWKYGERGFRHLYWDAGTMLANLLALCDAHGIAARVQTGFVDDRIAGLVGVDGITEFPLAVVSIGSVRPPDLRVSDMPSLDLGVDAFSPQPITFPLITEAQHAGTLANASAVDAWRDHALAGRPAPVTVDAPSGASSESIEQVILRRGSTRIMRPETAPSSLLWWAMAVAGRAVPADFVSPGTTLLEHDLLVHGIDGVDPGAYRWRTDGLELLRPGDMRVLGQQLCLDQPLGGDSAYTTFHCADLDGVLGPLGSRGYRAAQLEAGIASGRLSLAAFALGFGATGLTFFDEAVRRVFATEASCMLVTSVGIPDYRNTPGGRPGQTAELGRYGGLMQRLSLQLHRGRQ